MDEINNNGNVEVNAAFGEQADAAAEIATENDLKDAIAEKAEAEGAESAPETAEAEPKNDEFASKFAALSRKEKALRQREAEMESRFKEMEDRLKAYEEKENAKEPELPLDYKLKRNPLETLAELGLPYDKLTELALNDGKLTPDMQMEIMRRDLEDKYSKELESIRNDLLERDKKAEEQKYQETINSYVADLTKFVNASEKYELIKANDAVDLVFDVVENHYNETGNILSNEEAANLVESELEEELKRVMEKAGKKLGYGASEPKQSIKAPAQSPTLSNSQTTHVSTRGDRPLSEDESKAAAAQLIKWMD